MIRKTTVNMKILQEITDWATPNHVYITNDSKDKIYAYVKASNNELQVFSKPIKFSTSHRKFKEVPNQWGYTIPEKQPEGFIKIAVGSKGEKYQITEIDGVRHCTCPGFRFRSDCKHLSK